MGAHLLLCCAVFDARARAKRAPTESQSKFELGLIRTHTRLCWCAGRLTAAVGCSSGGPSEIMLAFFSASAYIVGLFRVYLCVCMPALHVINDRASAHDPTADCRPPLQPSKPATWVVGLLWSQGRFGSVGVRSPFDEGESDLFGCLLNWVSLFLPRCASTYVGASVPA